MPMHNPDIAQALDDIADLLELEGANRFRIRAYRNAARTLRGLPTDVTEMLRRGDDLADLPGIGEDLAGKIRTLAETGRLSLLTQLHKAIPPVATELLKLPGLGPKRVRALYQDLDIHSMEQLHRALLDGRVGRFPGFGSAIEGKLLQALAARKAAPGRLQRALAESYAMPLRDWLSAAPGVAAVVIAGSYRRCRETVGDIDLLISTEHAATVIKRLAAYDDVSRVVSAGKTQSTIVLRSGLQVDVRIVPPRSYGAALVYFTGSKAHNIALRRLGQQRGLKINEYGVFKNGRRLGGETEAEIYQAVGLPYIVPELREDRGEFEAARSGQLPKLVDYDDLRGDLHAHTLATDGQASIAEMAEAARLLGFEYLAITDHSRRLAMAHGLDPKRLRRQTEMIDAFNAAKSGITLLKGIEVDILEDGKLDLPASVLSELDLVIGAVHSQFNLSRAKQTARILRAMEQRYFTILAHPSGRLMPNREPYDVDMPRIIRGAQQRGCFLELNAHPDRLDLTDTYCHLAKDAGVLVSIASDAHRQNEFGNLRFDIGQARRGWLEKADVLNTRSLAKLGPLLARTMR